MKAQAGYAACLDAAQAFADWYRALLQTYDLDALNEAQTEDFIIRPVLDRLGWANRRIVQQAAALRDVPDYTLFPDDDAFGAAAHAPEAEKLRYAAAVAEAKAWRTSLDQRGGGAAYNETPAGQTLRYMDRAAQRSASCRWGILTNGRNWRLYFQGAADRLGAFFEIDLLSAIQPPGQSVLPLFGIRVEPQHAVALFLLFFGNEHFGEAQRAALDEGRLWETRVRADLANTVFDTIYPGLIRGLIAGDPGRPIAPDPAYLADAREAALTLLYRLLFVLYAEDRDLLPRHDRRFDDYALTQIRLAVAQRIDAGDAFSGVVDDLWRRVANLFRVIDLGEDALGIPAYNGKLFAADRSPMLDRAGLSDAVFAPLLDALSRRPEEGRRRWINYRDLSVRELGSIYERLLEYEPVIDPDADGGVLIRLSPFARKATGSYYTPDVLVRLIIDRTITPLVQERLSAFDAALHQASDGRIDPDNRRAWLTEADPATAILSLRVCDPAMGSGHFLVDLVDWLAGQVFTAIGGAERGADGLALDWRSPLAAELEALRQGLNSEAATHRWTIKPEQLTDANLIKRLVLKRCVYGVDKNPMAVELAKVSLWLHTFTAGAPLSFLDHHLRCGDSLFGEWVDEVKREADRAPGSKGATIVSGSGLFLGGAIREALAAETAMRTIERLSDARLVEVRESADNFAIVEEGTAALKGFLDFRHALRWLKPDREHEAAIRAFLDGQFGDPLRVAAGLEPMRPPAGIAEAGGQIDLVGLEALPEQLSLLPGAANARDFLLARGMVEAARELAAEQRFFHWQVGFPGVWRGWADARTGGFDAVIGNPPWDRMKMQEVEWFAERAPDIALQARAADRKAAISLLKSEGNPLATSYQIARSRTEAAMEVARTNGQYPLLSRGDVNVYALFVERAQSLIKADGAAGLLTPSGIASDLTAAPFFRSVSTAGRVISLLDFENRRGGGRDPFFPDVDTRFKFCAFVAGGQRRSAPEAECAFFLRDAPAPADPSLFHMTAADFARVNPNTGTAPVFRSERDAAIARRIYEHLPVLVDRSSGEETKAWPTRYLRMFDMTNDSGLFWTRDRLQAAGAYPIDGGRWARGARQWERLLEGKMVQAFDHRAANIIMNPANVHRPAQEEPTSATDKASPDFLPNPQFWVDREKMPVVEGLTGLGWVVGFKDVTAPTNERTMIAAAVPRSAYGNTLPVIWSEESPTDMAFWVANLNSFALDFVARSKVHGQHLNWFVVEQLPVVPRQSCGRHFGKRSADEIIRDHVLRLSYTAWDLADFARDMGHIREGGDVQPPFRWDEAERRQLRARLDALYFLLYGINDVEQVDYILSSFPIVERKDRAAFGVYLTRELIQWHRRALMAGDTERDAPEAELIADALRQRAA
ncbi:MAG TPA: hypothetical protein VGS12_09455 [Caulobacteraceae bacterium]|nr:hypothetical protein [Caulobacteraceae bacterium]